MELTQQKIITEGETKNAGTKKMEKKSGKKRNRELQRESEI
jgi:hypothetical protein